MTLKTLFVYSLRTPYGVLKWHIYRNQNKYYFMIRNLMNLKSTIMYFESFKTGSCKIM